VLCPAHRYLRQTNREQRRPEFRPVFQEFGEAAEQQARNPEGNYP
jgi:HSP20 family molecular chaperone IbpA